ncbi:putative type I restriction enzyme R protein [Roseovarius sp. TM1035]|uniref:DEAD/DEAH box helicase family protein n=1 Tax=Roseovarius sp. TM1035 TaxID=391613 RepID=UPI0001556B59|nr:DEAD/DEAH box helicase family protein [Roseovarius sp. TM1035]AWZ20551.1 Type I restriction-modification system, restriction subunit R [Roseovarius sp. AK1035]EDM31302.1 putative type I restriction enzyme R protein [Roseovarius sp. TM1035]
MKSRNFEFLRPEWQELAELGALAEAYAYADPASALVKLRLFAENLTKDIYRDLRLPKPDQATFIDLLRNESFSAIVPKVVLDKLHALRIHGNKAAHGDPASTKNALWLIKEAFDLSRWIFVQARKGMSDELPKFSEILQSAGDDTKGKLKREKRELLEKLAGQEAQMEKLLQELEEARQTATAAEKEASEIAALASSAAETANLLKFDEATTRARIIDSLIASAGWNVANGEVSTSEVGKEVQIPSQPTATGIGYADYVLWDDDGSPLAVVEAKKTSVDPETGRQQAKLYADGLEKVHGQRPVIFYTNGYDIWMWDDAGGYPPRKTYGYYSKDSLQYLVKFQRKSRKALNTIEPRSDIVNRLYQIEAIKRVSERFTGNHRKSLVVQATGTGKTRVAIALTELLIRAGWVKRVLFLCDRRELRKQAKNAFGDFLASEPIRVVSGRIDSTAKERIFIGTYPAMKKVFQSFDVGYFDLIIADESHRSIYNVYGDIFTYFDSLQIGLTATPVDFVTRSTFDLFQCEGQLPTANYDLEEAVRDGFLTPFEVFEHTTQFMREGITLDTLTAEQIKELEDQGEDPSQYDFAAAQIDNVIYNKDTNRAILRNLMENGLRDATGQTPGKSIIFARNHQHAVLLRQLFDEMYPQYGGRFCQVIDNYDPRAEQLIDDFKGNDDGKNDELTIAISVDMLDTGIDIPEILNLVFAKPVKSPVKFWQMIGRGTRLCEDLFGPGEHKSVFRIFDHWGNFERFETGYRPAEPTQSKSLLQLVFEERINLAKLALQKSEIAAFEAIIELIGKDINDLPEESVAVREKWREKRSLGAPETLKAFAPASVVALRQVIAPLMQWRNIRGHGDAYALDLLIARIQIAVLRQSNTVGDLKIDMLERLGALQMHLNPVREKADVIKTVKSDAFWDDLTVEKLEEVRTPLREIMRYRERTTGPAVPPKIIDVTETKSEVQSARRKVSLDAVNMKAYRNVVEEELRKHFDENPTLQRISRGEPVAQADIEKLVSLILAQTPGVNREILEEFFSETAAPLDFVIRSIIGLDPETVEAKFADFARTHPSLKAKQTRFLGLLKNHIARYGSITRAKLYEDPFTVVDADGPDGVFANEKDVDELMEIVDQFAPPATASGDQQEASERTKDQ